MKSRFITAVAAEIITLSALTATAAAADISTARLGSSVQSFEEYGTRLTEVQKSRTLKNTLVVPRGETLYIPSGVRLALTDGMKLEGNVYIEKGGKLTVKGGTMDISGAVVCDGLFIPDYGSALNVSETGRIYGSGTSFVKIRTQKVNLADGCTTVCVGKFTGYRDDRFCPNAVAAVNLKLDFEDKLLSSTQVSASEALMAAGIGYYPVSEFPAGGRSSLLTIFFDNGGAVTMGYFADGHASGLTSVCGVDISNARILTGNDGSTEESAAETLEQSIVGSDCIVRARCDSVSFDGETVDYRFTPLETLSGEPVTESFSVLADSEWSDEYTKYYNENCEYIIPLKKMTTKNREYYVRKGDTVIEVTNGEISSALFNGTAQKLTLEQLRTKIKYLAFLRENG